MNNVFFDVFQIECQNQDLSNALACADVSNFVADMDRRSISVNLCFDRTIDKAELHKVKMHIVQKYLLSEFDMIVSYNDGALHEADGALHEASAVLHEAEAGGIGGKALPQSGSALDSSHTEHHADKIADYETYKLKMEKQAVAEMLKEGAIDASSPIILGSAVTGQAMPIASVEADSGFVTIEGEVFFASKPRDLRTGGCSINFYIYDGESSISASYIGQKSRAMLLADEFSKPKQVRMSGNSYFDTFSNNVAIKARDVEKISVVKKMDNALEKRVELHVHTKMSAMDGTTSVTELVKRAALWGHKAIAVTDHGVVQAFPDAFEAGEKSGVKIIYGVEAYLVNDGLSIVSGATDQKTSGEFVVFDIETTGLYPNVDKVTEIGAVRIRDGAAVQTFSTFVNPGMKIPEKITQITGITDEMVADAPDISIVLPEFLQFCGDSVVVAHNASFDTGFIRYSAAQCGLDFKNCVLDTLELARALFPELKRHRLNLIAEHLGVPLVHHRALNDAQATAQILLKMFEMLAKKEVFDVSAINSAFSGENHKFSNSHHAIILVKNYAGLKNLYKLVSESHLTHFYKKPRIPKSLWMQHKEGLIIGSACEQGEIYSAIVDGRPKEEIDALARFYDYYEIQPVANNAFLVRTGKLQDDDAIRDVNRKVVELGQRNNKMVVATCDVHFLDEKDEVFRRILMAGQGFSDADIQAPLFFRTTEEMLDEFEYLGKDKAFEVVVKNTNAIADSIENMRPIPKGTFPPEIEGAERDLIDMTMKRAREIYGENLPEIVDSRVQRELASITKYGFSVMYIIAQKLVAKSLSDGYLVGSRGSVGSSVVAFLSGITEVNGLVPHYVCPKCKNSEFFCDGSIGSGYELEDKNCEKCGTAYKKDGHDIPFETFLGFEGDKEPDIDLNFSGDYQSVAHKYTEELFGEGNVFRAGTIGTIADKTAYGFVKKYLEGKDIICNAAEIERLKAGCTGVKRTTGQHPGGIMILPRDRDIHEFTPVQYPADDDGSGIITTHFDYHSISGRLLKLDILGHDDPTVIRMLQDLTGVNPIDIPLDDKATMSLFLNTDALGVKQSDINSGVGTFGIPEFGTRFVRQMLVDTKPTTFSELVFISGLSHGTNVWLNNAQELIKNGTAKLSEVISTRDDIMGYLIRKGMDKKRAFGIMENVRRGKGLKPDEEDDMVAQNVPSWYIESCKKIEYMFPKAHAAAYVTMAFRIAYFKTHYPLEFYLTYFTVRADDFDAEIMTQGKKPVMAKIKEIEKMGNEAKQKDKNVLTILEVCNEMYARGIKFSAVDVYKSHHTKFLRDGGAILPPLNALPGLGEKAAQSIVDARKQGEFTTVQDLKARTKISKKVCEILSNNGCLKGIPETDQVSMFD